jgi:hypothetical protein
LKAVPHITRSARQLWQERCQKASIINGTGTGSPYPITVSAYSPGTYVSAMTDFFEARSTGVDDSHTPSPEIGHDVCLFSQSSNDLSRATEVNIDRPSGAASLPTQSTVQNTSQLGSDDQTITDGPDPACGPAYINDGFDTVNVYFSYSKANRRMEVRTRGPLDPGKYEALVNYDDPYYPSGYWTKERRNLLPPETLARLQATYPAKIRASPRKIPAGWIKIRPARPADHRTNGVHQHSLAPRVRWKLCCKVPKT